MHPTHTIADKTDAPQRIKMSYEEYLDFADGPRLIEWVEGEAIVYMPPVVKHQNISGFLFYLIRGYVDLLDLGLVLASPFEVKLWPGGPAREPDLLFISHVRMDRLTDQRFEGGPDLVVEIVSPGSVTEDKKRKFAEYQQAGIREYWLIDPRPAEQSVTLYSLTAEGTFAPVEPDEGGRLASTVLDGFWLDPGWLWQDRLPKAHRLLAEIIGPDTFYEQLSG